MKSLKDLRMTLLDRPSAGSRSVSSPVGHVKHESSLQPPKQVIRATRDYASESPSELSFHRGDFFHVVASHKTEVHQGWLEACNPVTNARGLVPESYFDVLQRSSPTAAFNLTARSELNPHGVCHGNLFDPSFVKAKRTSGSRQGQNSWFATVKYDFFAERTQELDAKEGDGLLIVARSDMEWLVAKPLGRLGLPGLIPAGFIAFRDTTTGEIVPSFASKEIIEQLPTVKQWEQKNERYRQNAIPLGKFELSPLDQSSLTKTRDSPLPPLPHESPSDGADQSQNNLLRQTPPANLDEHFTSIRSGSTPQLGLDTFNGSGVKPTGSGVHDHSQTQSMYFLPAGLMTSAFVDAFYYEPNDYWFRLRVSYVSTLSSTDAPDRTQGHEVRDMILYRLYEDFVEFHVSLTQELMGSVPSDDSILLKSLPSLPGSLAIIDEQVASRRRYELDLYLRQLSTCPEQVLRSAPVRGFLELRPGDRCKTSVSVSKLNSSFRRTSGQHISCDSDIVSRLQGLSTVPNSRRHSPIDPISPTTSTRSSSTNIPVEVAPYYRIKVTRRDDPDRILAVRMPPKFTRKSLLLKIQERLGHDIQTLRPGEQLDGPTLTNDDDLNAWLRSTLSTGKKLLLCVDK